MPLKIVFLRPQNWSRLKGLLLKKYYRHQGHCERRENMLKKAKESLEEKESNGTSPRQGHERQGGIPPRS